METNDDVTMLTSLRKEKKAFYFGLSSKPNTDQKMFEQGLNGDRCKPVLMVTSERKMSASPLLGLHHCQSELELINICDTLP